MAAPLMVDAAASDAALDDKPSELTAPDGQRSDKSELRSTAWCSKTRF
jgi:hypothetical protein